MRFLDLYLKAVKKTKITWAPLTNRTEYPHVEFPTSRKSFRSLRQRDLRLYVFCGCMLFVSTPSSLECITAESVSKQGHCTSHSGAGKHNVLEIKVSCGSSSLLICKPQSSNRLLWKWCNLPKQSQHCHAIPHTLQQEWRVGLRAYLWSQDFCRTCTLNATAAPSTSPVPARRTHWKSVISSRQSPHKLEQVPKLWVWLCICCYTVGSCFS